MSDLTDLRQTSGWDGESLLSILLLNPVGQHTPRPLTQEIPSRVVGRVLTVSIDESIPRVFRKLSLEGILGCPVLDGNEYVGFISMLDLVKATNSLFWSDVEAEWVEFFDKKEEFANTTVRDLMDVPSTISRDPYPPIREDYTTFYALEKLARENLHRLPLVTTSGTEPRIKLSGIITQSMLISHLRQIKQAWGGFGDQLVSSFMDDLNKNIVSVKEDDTAINAFNMMEDAGVSGLPVLNKDNVLVGAVSVRDLRGVGHSGSKFFRLFRSVKDFKNIVSQEYSQLTPRTHWSTMPVPSMPVYVTPSQTMEDVLNKMEDGNLHRVFVCDEASVAANQPKVIAVISQGNVLKSALDWAIMQCEPYSGRMSQPEGAMGIHTATATAIGGTKVKEEEKTMKQEQQQQQQQQRVLPTSTITGVRGTGKINIPIS